MGTQPLSVQLYDTNGPVGQPGMLVTGLGGVIGVFSPWPPKLSDGSGSFCLHVDGGGEHDQWASPEEVLRWDDGAISVGLVKVPWKQSTQLQTHVPNAAIAHDREELIEQSELSGSTGAWASRGTSSENKPQEPYGPLAVAMRHGFLHDPASLPGVIAGAIETVPVGPLTPPSEVLASPSWRREEQGRPDSSLRTAQQSSFWCWFLRSD